MDVLFKENNLFYNVLCFLITENEKFFDRSDARLYWRTVFHVSVIIYDAYAGLFALSLDLSNYHQTDIQTLYKYRAAFLTGWNFILQTIFLTLSVVYDVLEWLDKTDNKVANKIRYHRDVIFSGMVFPFTMFVSSMFWTLFLIDRELVFPKVYDQIVPWWFNHSVHTNIFVVIALETLLQARRNPTDKKIEFICFWTISVGYAVVYYIIYFCTKRWLYNVFGIMNWWQVCLYQIGIWGTTYLYYRMQFPINRMIHGSGTQAAEKSSSPKVVDDERSKAQLSNGCPEEIKNNSLIFNNARSNGDTKMLSQNGV